MDEYKESNRKLWDDWTKIHEKSVFYDLPGFKAGRNTLHGIEREELGDVSGKSLLHLQCHFGMDTLSLARLGATVTGVDFSENAIELARSLSEELHIPATFIRSDIYDLPNVLNEQFDIVYTSYGVISWLPDLVGWARVIAHFLKPGGIFYIVEGHPFMFTFEQTEDKKGIEIAYPYFQGTEPLRFDVKGSYADYDNEYTGVEYGWNHSVGSIINSLVNAGLRIDFFHEFPYLAWGAFAVMYKDEAGMWRLPEPWNKIPLMFSLKATRHA